MSGDLDIGIAYSLNEYDTHDANIINIVLVSPREV